MGFNLIRLYIYNIIESSDGVLLAPVFYGDLTSQTCDFSPSEVVTQWEYQTYGQLGNTELIPGGF